MDWKKIVLAVTPEEEAECRGLGMTLLHRAFRWGPDGALLRRRALGDVRGGILGIEGAFPENADPARAAQSAAEACRDMGAAGVFTDAPPPALRDALLSRLTAQNALLFLRGAEARDGAFVFRTGEVTGGDCGLYYEELRRMGDGVGVELSPLAAEYLLPGGGKGVRLTPDELEERLARWGEGGFSPELCARYLLYTDEDGKTRLLLWDDAASLREKLRLSLALDFPRILLPYGPLREQLPSILPEE